MKKLAPLAAAALGLTLVLTGCNANDLSSDSASTGGTLSEPTKGGTLTILTSQTELDLDPGKSQNLAITTLGLLTRKLTAWKTTPGGETTVVPDLATDTGTPSEDGKVWTFTLKDGVKFEDGSEITSADVKYALERSFATQLSGGLSYHKTLLDGGEDYTGPFDGKELDSIETPDDKTIVFHLNKAYGDFPWVASQPAFAPVPKDQDDPESYGDAPVSSGPYKVESNDAGTQAVLVRNDEWDQSTDEARTAGPDSVVFKMGQDETVASQSIIADSGDAANSFSASFVPPSQLAQAQQDPNAKDRLVTSEPGALSYLAMNNDRPGLDNVKVRQAINYAVDKNSFRTAAGGEIAGDFATTLITPGIPGREEYDLYQAEPSGDVEKAKDLLAESGEKLDTLTLLTQNDSTSTAEAQAIQEGLKKAGIETTIKSVDPETWTAEATAKDADFDLTVSSWQPDFPSANGNIAPLFDSSQIGNGNYNISHYSNADVDEAIAKATGTVDEADAQKQWASIDEQIMEEAPIVPLMYNKNTFIHGSNVENFVIGAFPAYPNYLLASLKG